MAEQTRNRESRDIMLSGVLVAAIAAISVIAIVGMNLEPVYAPSFSVKVSSFNSSGTGCTPGCTQSVTGVGFQPKALILFGTDELYNQYDNGLELHIGFSDGTNDRAIAMDVNDNVDPTNTCRTNSETLIIKTLLSCNGGSTGAEAELQSFDSDGFTLNWLDVLGTGGGVQYIALGGSDITNVKVGTITSGTSTGNKAYTGVGFQPDFIMFLYDRQSGTGVSDHAGFGMGFATSSTKRGAFMGVSEDAQATSDTARAQRTDRVIYQLTPSNTANVNAEADFVSFDTDGFTLNWTDLPTDTNDKFHFMAIKGGKYDVGKFNQKNSTGTQSITGTGFTPTGLLFASFNNAAASTIQAHNRLSFGAASATTSYGAMWGGDKDNASVADAASRPDSSSNVGTSKVIRLATEPSTTDAAADLQSLDSNGFTLNWTTADTTAREIIYIAFGNT